MKGLDPLPLCYPYVPEQAKRRVAETLDTRWIGQGPQVDRFERAFEQRFCTDRDTSGAPDDPRALAVGSGTDALHLAYLLAGIEPGDEVLVPVFTCTATNIPLLYLGAQIKFVDVDPMTLNMDLNHLQSLRTDRTKAIVALHYGGLPCDLSQPAFQDVIVIQDAAHALGATLRGLPIAKLSQFSIFSFQAIKHITTGDGGMLTIGPDHLPTDHIPTTDEALLDRAKRMRWFGIDRKAKLGGIWANDIVDVGYKYQMTDIAAAMGLGALEVFDQILKHRQRLLSVYHLELAGVPGVTVVGPVENLDDHAAWLCTVLVEHREDLMRKLTEYEIESGQMHYRNDRYTIFEKFRPEPGSLPGMDYAESRYLVLPLHMEMDPADVRRVCKVIRGGW